MKTKNASDALLVFINKTEETDHGFMNQALTKAFSEETQWSKKKK